MAPDERRPEGRHPHHRRVQPRVRHQRHHDGPPTAPWACTDIRGRAGVQRPVEPAARREVQHADQRRGHPAVDRDSSAPTRHTSASKTSGPRAGRSPRTRSTRRTASRRTAGGPRRPSRQGRPAHPVRHPPLPLSCPHSRPRRRPEYDNMSPGQAEGALNFWVGDSVLPPDEQARSDLRDHDAGRSPPHEHHR